MMSFTVLLAALALLALVVIFGVSYAVKGLKTAFIAPGVAFVIFAIALVGIIVAIVRVMPN